MKIELNIKMPQKKIINYAYFMIGLTALILIYITSTFLYSNFYQAITQSKIILVLRKEVAPDSVDMEKFNYVIKKLEEKSSSQENMGMVKNPFR